MSIIRRKEEALQELEKERSEDKDRIMEVESGVIRRPLLVTQNASWKPRMMKTKK